MHFFSDHIRRQHRDFGRGHGGASARFDIDRGPRRHGHRGRVFDQGDLRYVILQLISDKPSHGYELIKAIEDRLGGAYSPSPGIVYPTLTLLEELGYVAASPREGAKKAYEITAEGRAALADNKAAVDSIFARMRETAEHSGARPAPQIVRAMENLRLALRLRLERGRPAEDVVEKITHALDSAAKAIESD